MSSPLPSRSSGEVRGVALALHLDRGERLLDAPQIVRGELDRSSADVLLQAVQLRRPGDRHDPGLLRQQPGERDLRRRRALPLGDRPSQIDQRLVRLARLRREARDDVAEVVLRRTSCSRRSCRSGSPCPSGLNGTKPMPSSSQRRQHLRLRLAPPQRVLALQRGHRLHRVRAADRLHARLRQAEVLDLALADQLLHRARDVLDRHVRIDAVLVEEVDRDRSSAA